MSTVYNPRTETYGAPTTTAVDGPPLDPIEKLVLDAPVKIKKKRAPKHDFGDGRGRVFAHRHDNGKGWVEDTAHVDDEVYVGPGAQIANYARVFGRVRLEAKASISGYATVFNQTEMHGMSRISGTAVVSDVKMHGRAAVTGETDIKSSHLYDAVLVRGAAVIKGCTMRGRTSVEGSVLMSGTSTHGFVQIRGSVILLNSSLRGLVAVSDFANVHWSTIDNFSYWCVNFKPDEYLQQFSKVRPDFVAHINEHANVYSGSRITAPISLRGRSMLYNCSVGMSVPGISSALIFSGGQTNPNYDTPTVRDVVWRDATIRDRESFDRLASGAGNNQQVGSVPQIRPEQLRSPFSLESMSRGRRVQPV